MKAQQQLDILKRGVVDLISEEELLKKIESGRPLIVKAGFDPTAPDLHLGHTVLLQKLKQFQDFGHQVIFLIGDYTAQVGDPSGRAKTRPVLTESEIKDNLKTYQKQVAKILDIKKTKTDFNSRWLGSMKPMDLLKLAGQYNVARMLERDDFDKRFKAGEQITLLEFLYPMLQAYDSVQLKADVELGGTDQRFNLVLGRTIQGRYGQEAQVVMTVPLLVGLDGVQKMSKSYDNHVGITDSPKDMFGKIMSISDQQMWSYYELLSEKSMTEIEALKKAVENSSEHPKNVKMNLAKEIISRYHSLKEAEKAALEFDAIFKVGGVPDDLETVKISAAQVPPLFQLLHDLGLTQSRGEARRLIKQSAVSINEIKALDENKILCAVGTYLIKVGKRRFIKLQVG